MLSLILPYWNRPQAANDALHFLQKHYPDIEIIVVDDGSDPPFEHPFPTILRLPAKQEAQATCTPINAGVKAAKHDIIALSSVEMIHKTPVLYEMHKTLTAGDKNTYVSAAVWSPEECKWHAHSGLGAPLHFMTMLHRDLWDRAGGMDEEYRDGICFDDNDLLQRLLKAGMHYVFRDDLVVHHPRRGAKCARSEWRWLRNEALYKSKWNSPRSN